MNEPTILFYFLHLLGVGHVYRAKRLIEGMTRQGLAVDVIYGGDPIDVPLDARNVFHLPPIRAADATYKTMLDETGMQLSKDYLDRRQAILMDHCETLDPDAVLVEAFPFGRRVVRQEILAMIDHYRDRARPPLIVSSVRDILQENRKPGRLEEATSWVETRFDRVLVHSDPALIPLDATFPAATQFPDKLAYTGFVVPEKRDEGEADAFDIIVSIGGGAFGGDLLTCAAHLSAHPRWRELRFCLATGPNLPAEARDIIKSVIGENATLVTRLEDLTAHLRRARLSVSQCGYNTAMDVLQAHQHSACRAVFVPHDTTGQTEQLRRAELLDKAGYAVCLPQSQLSVEALSSAMDHALDLPKVDHDIDFSGVDTSATLLRRWIKDRKP